MLPFTKNDKIRLHDCGFATYCQRTRLIEDNNVNATRLLESLTSSLNQDAIFR